MVAAVALILSVGWVMTKRGHTVGDVLVGLALGGVSVLVAGVVARLRRAAPAVATGRPYTAAD